MRTHRRGSTGPFGRRSSHLGYDGDRGWLTSGLACRSNWCTRFKSPGLKSQQVYRCTAQTGWTAYLGVVYRERIGGKSRFFAVPGVAALRYKYLSFTGPRLAALGPLVYECSYEGQLQATRYRTEGRSQNLMVVMVATQGYEVGPEIRVTTGELIDVTLFSIQSRACLSSPHRTPRGLQLASGCLALVFETV
jgi:hypothetical protein